MKCPNCGIVIHTDFYHTDIRLSHNDFSALDNNDFTARWITAGTICPSCKRAIIFLNKLHTHNDEGRALQNRRPINRLIFPKGHHRAAAPREVPPDIAEDFNESCAVLTDSPKASAALSRRCLQGLLRAQGFLQKDLVAQITAITDAKLMPSRISQMLDAVRNIGNFAAHPMKDTNTGEILPVEPEEAEWNLDTLESLFDFFYVEPARDSEKIEALNAKLAAAGKPLIKIGN